MNKTVLALGVGWLCASIALFLTSVFQIENPTASAICFLSGLSSTMIALNV